MSWQFNINNAFNTEDSVLVAFKDFMVATGWSVTASSNGTTWGWSDVIASTPSGSTWLVLKQPAAVYGGQRSWLIHVNSSASYQWRIKYSYTGAFTGGSPSTTVLPTATDEVWMWGSDSPSYVQLMPSDIPSNNRRIHMVADNAAPYTCGYWGHTIAGGATDIVFFMDSFAAGTFPGADVDPYLLYFDYGSNPFGVSTFYDPSSTDYISKGIWKKGLSGEALAVTPALMLYDSSGVVLPSNAGMNPYEDKDDMFPVFYARRSSLSAPTGLRGQSSLFLSTSCARNTDDMLTLNTSKDRYIVRNGITVPWNGTEPLI
jgi:hypothetical protein